MRSAAICSMRSMSEQLTGSSDSITAFTIITVPVFCSNNINYVQEIVFVGYWKIIFNTCTYLIRNFNLYSESALDFPSFKQLFLLKGRV